MPDICFWNKCNNKCIMCTNSKEFSLSDPKGNYDLKTQLLKFKAYLKGGENIYFSKGENRDFINLTGGEPTIHPNFFELLYFMRKKATSIPITLLSNGRKFSSKEFTIKFSKIAINPFSIAIALHCDKEKQFEKISGAKGSFKETIQGLDNLFLYFKGIVEIRIILHKLNINCLKGILEFIDLKWGKRPNLKVILIHYEIEGMSEINKKIIKLKLSQSAKVLNKNINLLKKFDFNLYHWPLCVLDKKLRKYALITLPIEDRIYTKKCKTCLLKKKCLGLMKEYYKYYKDNELKPIKKYEYL